MSQIAIDNARTNERLSMFLSRIDENEPVDNVFVDLPLLKELMGRRTVIDGGRQSMIIVETDQNSTVDSFEGNDTFDTSVQDTTQTAVFAYKNYGATVTLLWEEKRETATDDVRTFDLLRHRRNSALMSMKDRMNSDMFVVSPASKDLNSLPFLITTTGTVGGIDSSTDTFWQSQETTSVGAFTSNGMTNMRSLWNDILRQGQGTPDLTLTTQAIFEAYEAEQDPDVRYENPDVLARGATSLVFKGKPIMFDADMTAGELYIINFDWLKFVVDTDGQFTFDEFQTPVDQKSSTAKLVFRGQLITTNRRALGRLTGVT